jgi:hypothetical protein
VIQPVFVSGELCAFTQSCAFTRDGVGGSRLKAQLLAVDYRAWYRRIVFVHPELRVYARRCGVDRA